MGVFSQFCFERLLQSTGRTTLAMFTQLLGAVINIIMDPILIFGLLGLPSDGGGRRGSRHGAGADCGGHSWACSST